MDYRKHARQLRKSWMSGIVFCIFCLALAACSSPARSTSPAGEEPAPTSPAATIGPTETPAPTATPQPRAVFLAPEGSNPNQTAALQALLAGLAADSGLRFETLKTLSPAELTPQVRVVVALPPDPGLAALAAAAPQTQFLAIDLPGIEPAENLAPVSALARPDQQGFLAGYLASLVTPDWRVAVISPAAVPAGRANRQGFLNGTVFYCGLCRPAYPPFVQYPVSAELASGASPADQQAAADSLLAQGVKTVYVAPGAGDESLLRYLAGQGVNLIGSSAPPADLGDHWIATITADLEASLRQAWNQALNGQPVSEASLPLAITDQNETLFSIGRQRLAEQIRDELAAGLIDTGVDPQTGEPH